MCWSTAGPRPSSSGKLDDPERPRVGIPDGVITIAQPYDTLACQYRMSDLIAAHAPLLEVELPAMEDTFSLVYTSGTTGDPKGIVITFRNIGYSSTTAVKALGYRETDRLVSYLPLAHITERAMVQHVGLYHGCTVSFTESLETFAEDLRNARPTIFISVPRLWMKFQAGVLAQMPQRTLDRLLRIPILSGMVRRKIRAGLGLADTRICGSGAAPIPPAVLEWFARLGIQIAEGFGMSETSGLVTANYPFRRDKIGTVGSPAEGSRIRISAEGELLIAGDCVVAGYYKDPDKTAEIFRSGWLHTGDKGQIDGDGYLRITGRVKDIFKTGKGKYVAPAPIENLIAENPYVEQVCVMGCGLPQPVAVVVMGEGAPDLLDLEEDRAALADTLRKTNARLEAHEKLSHIVVVRDPWTVENGLLTPTLKIKRHLLEDRYTALIATPATGAVILEPHAA